MLVARKDDAAVWWTMSVIRTFGGHHSDVQEVSVPVFTSTQRIEAGAEIKIFAKKDETAADKKKEKKGETWREITKKQELSSRARQRLGGRQTWRKVCGGILRYTRACGESLQALE